MSVRRSTLVPPPLGLLGAHVGRSAQHLALDCLAAIGVGRQRDGRSECLLRAFNELRQPPVEDDHFAVVAQDHVLWLEIAVDHAAAVGVGDGVADPEEGPQERPEFERVELALGAATVELLDRLREGAALDEPHRVERLAALAGPHELMDRDDVGVLELAGDLGLFQETGPDDRIIRLLGPQFLEGHLATKVGVAPARPGRCLPARAVGSAYSARAFRVCSRLSRSGHAPRAAPARRSIGESRGRQRE